MENKSDKSKDKYDLTIGDDQLHEFWRHFQDAGNQVKQNMIRTVTWALALASGVLSYLVGKLHMFGQVDCTDLLLSRFVAIMGFLLCICILLLVREFGKAMAKNWTAADQIGDALAEQEGVKVSIERSRNTPKICWWMYGITGGLAAVFITGFLHLILAY